ncbi:MAG TPA: CHAT domain-containing protein [Thermoanaerobaculia bacterium]|jgi:tetratricopeptide (TPR) repeat protein
MTTHVAPQKLVRLAEGRLARAEMPEVLEHLDSCVDCTEQLEMANEVLADEMKRTVRPPQQWRWWTTLAAAAILAVAGVVAYYGLQRNDSGIAQLVALAPQSQRLVEPRLSGGFAWAEYRGPDRATGDDDDSAKMKLVGAAGEAKERAARDDSAGAQHTAGVAMLLVDRSDEAIRALKLTTERAPDDPAAWSDLAAAQYAAAVRLRRSSLFPEALASADAALRIDPKHPEALFNRALILQRIGLRDAAREAWQAYLNVDGSSQWATEAQRYLKEIPPVDQDAQFKRELPRLEAGQDVREIVAKYPQQARTWGEGVYLGAWAEKNGDPKQLAIARAIGVVLRERGETLLSDAVAAIDKANATQRAALIAAHAEYKRGRMLYAQRKPTEAADVLLEAARKFEQGGSPMRFLARYFAANALYEQREIQQACARLAPLLAESERHAGYVSLVAQIQWQLSICAMAEPSWNKGLAFQRKAEAAFLRLRELRNAAVLSAMVASTLSLTGRNDEAWDARMRAFDSLSEAGNRERVIVALALVIGNELQLRRIDAARALAGVEEAMARDYGSPVLHADALKRSALIATYLDDRNTAARFVADAERELAKIADAGPRRLTRSNVDFAKGALYAEAEPHRAIESLSRAIADYETDSNVSALPEAYLLRGRAAMRLNDANAARADLDRGLSVLERHAVHFGGAVVGTGVFDAGTALFDEAIRFALDRGEEEAAFILVQRAHAQLSLGKAATIDADQLRERLAGSGVAVLDLIALPREVIAFCVTERGLSTSRTPVDAAQLAGSIAREDLRGLYDILIRPSLASIGNARALVIVAAPQLRNIPFAALEDSQSKRRLIQHVSVVMAPGAGLLTRGNAPAGPRSLLAVLLPSGEANATLDSAVAEVADLRALYSEAAVLASGDATYRAFVSAAPRANVLHIAGHTDREPAAEERAFVFSRGERVSWRTLAETPIGHDSVVVLSACETLRAAGAREERSLSLGEAFLAAGARAVVGTLQPIADRDARELFAAFHRHLASGLAEHEALRRVQLDQIAHGTSDAWRSVVLITNRIPASY